VHNSPIVVEHAGPAVTVTLNRPDVRNALDDTVVSALTEWARGPMPEGARAAILRGAGKTFCAGADLAWMSRMVEYSVDENVREASALADMFHALDALPIALIGQIHGAALGGGAGLAAVCDIVVAADDAVFGFTEAKLGIVPAVISPFVLAKIGVSAARELFLTAARFPASRAREIGLAHAVVPASGLEGAVEAYVKEIESSAPGAVTACKRLVAEVANRAPADVARLTAEAIAARRISPEGQDGMRAFLAKRPAPWVPRRAE
jgi:methylglutaconyl-CoA hydratase